MSSKHYTGTTFLGVSSKFYSGTTFLGISSTRYSDTSFLGVSSKFYSGTTFLGISSARYSETSFLWMSSALTRCTDSGIWSPKDLDTENTSFSRCFSLLPASELRLNCFSDVILREKADPLLHGHIARLPSAGLR